MKSIGNISSRSIEKSIPSSHGYRNSIGGRPKADDLSDIESFQMIQNIGKKLDKRKFLIENDEEFFNCSPDAEDLNIPKAAH